MNTFNPPPEGRIVWCCRRYIANGDGGFHAPAVGSIVTEWWLAKRNADPVKTPWKRDGSSANEALLWTGVNDWKDKTWGDILVVGWAEINAYSEPET